MKFAKNSWINSQGASFVWESNCNPEEFCYIETQINLLDGLGLKISTVPSFYVWYVNNRNKNFISCGNDKYGNPRVIMQMQEFGFWVDGYPAIKINKKEDIGYSVIIINPYDLKGKFKLEINELKIFKTIVVEPRTVSRVNLHKLLKIDKWTGQIYVSGNQRAIIYFMNHSIKDDLSISTLEHSDPFRAELSYKPRFMYLREAVHRKLKKFIIDFNLH